jgi:nucleotide-binding universal stress UspA family protein
MIKSILLSVDGSGYTDTVLRYGIHCSKSCGALLRVLTVIDVRIFEWAVAAGADGFVPIIPSALYQEESRRLLEERADAVLKKCGEILESEKCKFELLKISGPPVDVICEQALTVDLVIIGARGEFARWESKMIGATVEAVSRLCNKSILVIDKDFSVPTKMLMAYDGSLKANRALTIAGFMAQHLEVPMTVLTVTDQPEHGRSILREAERYLEPFDIEVKCELAKGVVDEVIVKYADDNNCNLIAMGAYGHSRIREAILGSHTEQIIRKARVPVLLAK